MRIEIVPDEGALAGRAAAIICGMLRRQPDALLGLPSGNTPIVAYAELRRRVASGACYVARATVYAVDEFAGVTRDTPGTNSMYYIAHLDGLFRAVHVPDPAAADPDEHIRAFADAIRRAGGLDLCVLGIGANGHVAFNEPGAARDSRARVVELHEPSRAAHAATFGALERVPQRGMTLGIADLLEARALLVMAHGSAKAAVVRAAIEAPATPDVPASLLRDHPDLTWLLDEAAASSLSRAPKPTD